MVAEWRIKSEDIVLRTPWFAVSLAAVDLPGGRRLDHYVFRLPPVVLTAMLDEQDRVLLVWRYRFIPGTWGWELPSGLASPHEDLITAGQIRASSTAAALLHLQAAPPHDRETAALPPDTSGQSPI